MIILKDNAEFRRSEPGGFKIENEKKDKHWYPPYRVFRCECDSEKDLSYDELIQHAKDNHSIDVKRMKMTRELIMHVNRIPRHSCTYRWRCHGFKFYEEIG